MKEILHLCEVNLGFHEQDLVSTETPQDKMGKLIMSEIKRVGEEKNSYQWMKLKEDVGN